MRTPPKNQFGWNLRFLGTVLLVISIERGFQRIVDHYFALYLMVVKKLGNFSHAHDRSNREAILFLNFLLRGFHAALANFHTVQRNDKALNLNIAAPFKIG